jgi:hypothetical protein
MKRTSSESESKSDERRREADERPSVLSVRFGANPNSSSLGVDVSFLLFGGTAALAAGLMLSAWLRARRRPIELNDQSTTPTPPSAPTTPPSTSNAGAT